MTETLIGAVEQLRSRLATVELPYQLPTRQHATERARQVADQLSDYVLPRLESLDAPVLAVVGGSTGAGKSTLVSSLVGRPVVASSAIRPTTRRPVLLHAPGEGHWFETDRVLGSLARVRVEAQAPATPPASVTARELELRESDWLVPGLALLDAPDVDSVADDNRALATALLASADLWVFVTTAARYADAVPWHHLRQAAARDVTVAIVLNRVPPEADEVEADLRRRLGEAGLGQAPVFVIGQAERDEQGLLASELVRPVGQWLGRLAADAQARRQLSGRTVRGALQAAAEETEEVARALEGQEAEHDLPRTPPDGPMNGRVSRWRSPSLTARCCAARSWPVGRTWWGPASCCGVWRDRSAGCATAWVRRCGGVRPRQHRLRRRSSPAWCACWSPSWDRLRWRLTEPGDEPAARRRPWRS
ncbi:dynamin family protein [Actinomyces faecalis]|uniref:dynamin family protein n=1 Tax=Actinomyces faecalis TaxID=2722820 RepID=UPI001557D902|nr:dynamin family protein [Actinomyces faecalis]